MKITLRKINSNYLGKGLFLVFYIALFGCSGDASFTGNVPTPQDSDGPSGDAVPENDPAGDIGIEQILADAASSVDDAPGDEQIAEGASTEEAAPGDESSAGTTAAELEAKCIENIEVKDHKQVITFKEPANTCEFGTDAAPVNGNYGKVNGRISARTEEYTELTIPKGALLCNMSLSFANGADGKGQAMYYDDEIFITLNNIILAASQKLNLDKLFDTKDGFMLWNWDKLVKSDYTQGNGDSSVYCAGAATDEGACQIPATQTNGNIAISLEDSLVRKAALAAGVNFDMGTNLAEEADFSFGFITTGDNDDPIDCKHSTFQLTVDATYVMP